MDSNEAEHADTVSSPAAERHSGIVDEADLAELVAPHLEAMTHLADRLAGPVECYAVIERALALAWKRRGTLAGKPGNARARLLAIVAGCAWRKGARKRRPAKRLLAEAVSGYEPDTELAEALRHLPRPQRVAVELRWYLQENGPEAAGSLGREQAAAQDVLAEATGKIASRLSVTADSAEQRLRQDASRWRSHQRPAARHDARHFADALAQARAKRFGLLPTGARRFWLLPAGIAVAAAVAATALAWSSIPSGGQAPADAFSWPASVPLPSAHPPRTPALTPTRLITLESRYRHTASWKISWKLQVQVRRQESSAQGGNGSSGPDLCYGVKSSNPASFFCGGKLTSSLQWLYIGPDSGSPAGTALAYGVTSVSAARVVFTFAGTTSTVTTYTASTPAIPGLYFFSAVIPVGYQTAVEAIAANGQPIERTSATCVSASTKSFDFASARPFGFGCSG